MIERRRRQEELLLIEQQRQELNIERQQIAQIRSNIDRQKHDLQIRENKLIEYESLIPSVRELQGCGITLALILPYITANNLVNDIKEYRELGHLQGSIKRAEERIAALDAFNTQKQQAVMTLMNLQLAGFSEKSIAELVALVSRWNKQ